MRTIHLYPFRFSYSSYTFQPSSFFMVYNPPCFYKNILRGRIMKLHEYQSKTIFSKYGIPIPKGRVAATAQEARQVAEELGSRVVIKAQVLVGGRGKSGGIMWAKT